MTYRVVLVKPRTGRDMRVNVKVSLFSMGRSEATPHSKVWNSDVVKFGK